MFEPPILSLKASAKFTGFKSF